MRTSRVYSDVLEEGKKVIASLARDKKDPVPEPFLQRLIVVDVVFEELVLECDAPRAF